MRRNKSGAAPPVQPANSSDPSEDERVTDRSDGDESSSVGTPSTSDEEKSREEFDSSSNINNNGGGIARSKRRRNNNGAGECAGESPVQGGRFTHTSFVINSRPGGLASRLGVLKSTTRVRRSAEDDATGSKRLRKKRRSPSSSRSSETDSSAASAMETSGESSLVDKRRYLSWWRRCHFGAPRAADVQEAREVDTKNARPWSRISDFPLIQYRWSRRLLRLWKEGSNSETSGDIQGMTGEGTPAVGMVEDMVYNTCFGRALGRAWSGVGLNEPSVFPSRGDVRDDRKKVKLSR